MKDWTLKCYIVFLIVRKNENNSVIIKKNSNWRKKMNIQIKMVINVHCEI